MNTAMHPEPQRQALYEQVFGQEDPSPYEVAYAAGHRAILGKVASILLLNMEEADMSDHFGLRAGIDGLVYNELMRRMSEITPEQDSRYATYIDAAKIGQIDFTDVIACRQAGSQMCAIAVYVNLDDMIAQGMTETMCPQKIQNLREMAAWEMGLEPVKIASAKLTGLFAPPRQD